MPATASPEEADALRALSLTLLAAAVLAGCAAPDTVENRPPAAGSAAAAANHAPVAQLTATPLETVPGQAVVFDGAASHDADGGISNYRWDFGDGSTPIEGPQVSARHTFDQPGAYRVTLTVSDRAATPATNAASVVVSVALVEDVEGDVAPAGPDGTPAQAATTWFFVRPGAQLLRWEFDAIPLADAAQVYGRLISPAGDVAWSDRVDAPPEGARLGSGLQGAALQPGSWRLEVSSTGAPASVTGKVLVSYRSAGGPSSP